MFHVLARAWGGVARRSLHTPILPLGRLLGALRSRSARLRSPAGQAFRLPSGRLHCVRRAGALLHGPPCGVGTGVRLCQAFRLPLRSRPVPPIFQSSGGHRTPPAPQSLGGVATPFRRRALCLARLGARAGTPSGRPPRYAGKCAQNVVFFIKEKRSKKEKTTPTLRQSSFFFKDIAVSNQSQYPHI